MRWSTYFLLAILVTAAVFVFARYAGNNYYYIAGYMVLQYVVLATAWNILGGYAGYVNFGSSAFFAAGAYSSIAWHVFNPLPLPVLIVLAGAVSGIIGLGAGYLTLRLRGVFFAIATLALAIVLQTLITNWDYVGGSRGAYILRPSEIPILGNYIEYLFLVMLLGAMCSYILARYEFPGRMGIYYMMLAGLTFPVFLAVVPLFNVLKGFGLLNTLPGLTITYVAFALPFTVFFLYAFFRSLPREVAEAAALDGAGPFRIFFQIMLPMAKPGMASVAIFNFLGLWNQFLLPIALNTNTKNYVLSQGMASFASQAGYAVNFGALFAAVIITVLPVLVTYIIFQRQLQGSVSSGLLK